jgi:hypothetical protein
VGSHWNSPNAALEFLRRHAGAGAAGIVEPAVVGVIAQQQRADVGSAALGIGPADDNEFLAVEAAVPALDQWQPGRTAVR